MSHCSGEELSSSEVVFGKGSLTTGSQAGRGSGTDALLTLLLHSALEGPFPAKLIWNYL